MSISGTPRAAAAADGLLVEKHPNPRASWLQALRMSAPSIIVNDDVTSKSEVALFV